MERSSIIGRDGYITAKALIYAIATIQSFRPAKQEWSDMLDMIALAKTIPHDMRMQMVASVVRHTGRTVNLDLDGGDDGTD